MLLIESIFFLYLMSSDILSTWVPPAYSRAVDWEFVGVKPMDYEKVYKLVYKLVSLLDLSHTKMYALVKAKEDEVVKNGDKLENASIKTSEGAVHSNNPSLKLDSESSFKESKIPSKVSDFNTPYTISDMDIESSNKVSDVKYFRVLTEDADKADLDTVTEIELISDSESIDSSFSTFDNQLNDHSFNYPIPIIQISEVCDDENITNIGAENQSIQAF